MLAASAAVAMTLTGCVSARPSTVAQAPAPPGETPAGIQYLYGSGEAAAVSLQTWRALTAYVESKVANRPAEGMVLTSDATLAAPRWTACGAKPLAAVFDVDETVLLNLGFEYDAAAGNAFTAPRWSQWEQAAVGRVAPVPGAKAALDRLRALGVTVVFNTNRSLANVAYTERAIEGVGLGPAKHLDTLYVAGDDAMGSRKDGRRATIAARYCVIAMGGDQLGDFSDLFNTALTPAERRAAAQSPAFATRWGAGWFMLPNPAYGPSLKGTRTEIFPDNVRWTPGEGVK